MNVSFILALICIGALSNSHNIVLRRAVERGKLFMKK